jgi:hypothetical protein
MAAFCPPFHVIINAVDLPMQGRTLEQHGGCDFAICMDEEMLMSCIIANRHLRHPDLREREQQNRRTAIKQ